MTIEAIVATRLGMKEREEEKEKKPEFGLPALLWSFCCTIHSSGRREGKRVREYVVSLAVHVSIH